MLTNEFTNRFEKLQVFDPCKLIIGMAMLLRLVEIVSLDLERRNFNFWWEVGISTSTQEVGSHPSHACTSFLYVGKQIGFGYGAGEIFGCRVSVRKYS